MEPDHAPRSGRRTAHLASRMLPAFGLGVMGTFLVCRHGWDVSTPLQRLVFALGAASVLLGLGLDVWLSRTRERSVTTSEAETA